jgi:hypothetical protein
MGSSFVAELADNGVELVKGDTLVGCGLVVDVGAVKQLKKVIIIDVFVELLGDGLELLEVNCSVLVLVVEGKDSLKAVSGLGLTDLGGDSIEELFEVDGLVLILKSVDKVEDEGVSLVEAEFLEDLVNLHGVDGSATVLIEHLKGVLEFVVVLSGETVLPGSGDGLGLLSGAGGGLGVAGGGGGFSSAHNI